MRISSRRREEIMYKIILKVSIRVLMCCYTASRNACGQFNRVRQLHLTDKKGGKKEGKCQDEKDKAFKILQNKSRALNKFYFRMEIASELNQLLWNQYFRHDVQDLFIVAVTV